jgi:hypothetical protein
VTTLTVISKFTLVEISVAIDALVRCLFEGQISVARCALDLSVRTIQTETGFVVRKLFSLLRVFPGVNGMAGIAVKVYITVGICKFCARSDACECEYENQQQEYYSVTSHKNPSQTIDWSTTVVAVNACHPYRFISDKLDLGYSFALVTAIAGSRGMGAL